MVNVKLPVRVNLDGEFSILENHSEITVEPMIVQPEKTFHTLYGKLIEYIRENPSYLATIISNKEQDVVNQDQYTEITHETVLHSFPYFKKSKKPLNTSFRNKGTKHNFTKKNYENH